ncbi:DUF4135 domain-containing protein [Erwinia sp. E602]|uniref:type 2 lanthipeptide synthetase LanM n=1 Tax=Erwinia sp. E602 TaxID=2675378 RepID=UPI001BAB1056|nr:type 2 lanthipeptide synthetase LanM [Erwinia sp. E602]QUG75571.1 DUF4135 domain-containing protein [Erwinia sp. E602]
MATFTVIEKYRAFLYHKHLVRFNLEINDLLSFFNHYKVDFSDVLENIAEVMDNIFLPNFVLDFDAWLRNSPGNNNDDRYKNYFKNACGEWRKEILGKDEFIECLAEKICKMSLANIRECLSFFESDRANIETRLNVKVRSKIKKISLLGGDRHENGKQPVLIELDESKLIYKPRRSGSENYINEVCHLIKTNKICPETLDMKDHLWQEFIRNDPIEKTSMFNEAYFNYGIILSFADLLNINDCHFDNFIINREKAYMIDSETIFQYYAYKKNFKRSIYHTGLIQSEDAIANGLGHTSAITAVTNIFNSYCYPYAVDDKTERIKIKYENSHIKKTKNYPHLDGVATNPCSYIKEVIEGFEKGYRLLTLNRREVLSLLTEFKIKSRCLIRTTSYYLLVINKILHPAFTKNHHHNIPMLTDKYLRYKGEGEAFNKILKYEISSMMNYDVPIFYSFQDSTALKDGDGKIYMNFFPQPPVNHIKKNLVFNKGYLDEQKNNILMGMGNERKNR